jgi:hypothetical protein
MSKPKKFAACALGASLTLGGCGSHGTGHETSASASEAALTAQDSVLQMTVTYPVEDDCTQIYSPTVLQDPLDPLVFHMWYGGWQNCADRNEYGNDRIYHSTSTDLVNWTPPLAVITSATQHFNDPTVVSISYPVAGVPTPLYLMYMTGCTTAADCFTTGHNVTYGATSFDGLTWSTPQVVIGVDNGLNEGGAWSPSAVKISDELIYLYYFVNTADASTDGQVQRSSVAPQTDFFTASSPTVVVAPYHVNPDVHVTERGFEMLYDSGSPFQINRLISADGVNFAADTTFPGIDGAASGYQALTGHAFPVPGNPSQYWLYFGWGSVASQPETISIMGWLWQRP